MLCTVGEFMVRMATLIPLSGGISFNRGDRINLNEIALTLSIHSAVDFLHFASLFIFVRLRQTANAKPGLVLTKLMLWVG